MKDDYKESYAYKRELKSQQRFLEFVTVTNEIEQVRNKSFKEVNPELHKFINNLYIKKFEDFDPDTIDKIRYLHTVKLRHIRRYLDFTTEYPSLFAELLDSDGELIFKSDES